MISHRHFARSISAGLALSLLLAGCAQGPKSAGAAPAGDLEENSTVDIRPRLAGTVDRIGFEAGAKVTKGQILFRIDPRPFREETERQYIERAHALTEMELARANRARTQRLVGRGPMPAEDAERLDEADRAAAGHLAAATAALNAAKLELEFTAVRAPIDGRVSRSLVKQGDRVSSNVIMTTVVAGDELYAVNRSDSKTSP